LKAFGVVGVITGPAALVLIRSIVDYVEQLEQH
jgi:predicted PurR-regulated permease PerM